MSRDIYHDICERAVKKWGSEPQLNQLQEECSELAVAISHHRRGRSGSAQAVLEEIGDVYLLLAQATIIFGKEAINQACLESLCKLNKHLGDRNEQN